MFQKILLVAAAADDAQSAVSRTRAVAARGAKVEVFDRVYEPLLSGYLGRHEVYESLRRHVVAERSQAAEKIAAALAAQGLRASAKAVREESYAQAVAREAVAAGADLVVAVPVRGRAYGVTQEDWRMLSTCSAPVLVVKSDGASAYRRLVAAVDPLHEHGKPAELDAAILALATRLAAHLRASVRAVHCFTPLAELALHGVEHVPLDDAERALEKARRAALGALAAGAGLPPESADIVAGKPSAVLESLAERGEADLVIMGGLSRGRLKDFLIGSTAERVLERSTADVLIVKPPGFRLPFAAGR